MVGVRFLQRFQAGLGFFRNDGRSSYIELEYEVPHPYELAKIQDFPLE